MAVIPYAWFPLFIDSFFRPTTQIMTSCGLLSNFTSRELLEFWAAT